MIVFTNMRRNGDDNTYKLGDTIKELKKEVKFFGL